jgi:hypothetical protein
MVSKGSGPATDYGRNTVHKEATSVMKKKKAKKKKR